MKTLLSLISFLLCMTVSFAQDLTLPQGISNILLHSGKTVKGVTLWRIDSVNVEYVLKGNLADVNTVDVSKIETPEFLIEFNARNQMIKKGYDVIVLFNHDTLRGFIQQVDEEISYRPIGSDKMKRVMTSQVENYFSWGNSEAKSAIDSTVQKDIVKISSQLPVEKDSLLVVTDVSISSSANQTALTDSNPIETSKEEKQSIAYDRLSYERGVSDADWNDKSVGWGGGGFLLGMTIGSPILSLAATSHVSQDNIPAGVDEKLYRAGYENEIVKKRAKKAAAGAILGKALILIILIASL